jgi:fructose-bisphosphate aldolase, class II
MPIATPEVYAEMLDRAKAGAFAYPAINVTSSQTLNAALQGFSEAGSDGIVQVSTGGAEYLSGQKVKDMVIGAQALAEFAHHVAKAYPINIALHTDHCPKNKLDGYMRPLIKISQERVAEGREPLFQSHMWDGSAVELEENLQIAQELLAECAKARIVMELEIGVVGGEEDGVANEINEKLYTTPGDALRTVEALDYGVVKKNVVTDTQYAFKRPIVDHLFRNYVGVLKVDGEVGNKKQYDPRAYGKSAEAGMAARVVEACEDLRSAGTAL